MIKTSKLRRFCSGALAALVLAGTAGLIATGCSAKEAEPATVGGDTAMTGSPQQQPYPPAPPPGPAFARGTDLDQEQRELDDAEKQLDFALQNKTALGEPLDTSTDRCTIVCRALTSMRTSAKHVCSLAAERCQSANDRVKNAEERARGACPACVTPT